MIPIPFPQANMLLTAEGCNNIPAYKTTGEVEGLGEVPYFITVWRLTDIEIEKLSKSHYIQLNIVGNSFPPVSLQVIDAVS